MVRTETVGYGLRTGPSEAPGYGLSTPVDAARSAVVYTKASDLEWIPVDEPRMPEGMEISVIEGDPTQNGPFLAFLSFPPGATLEPHTHPLRETLMVAEGSMEFGQGTKKGDRATLLEPGAFVDIPPDTHHWLSAGRRGATLLVLGNGPLESNFYPGTTAPKGERIFVSNAAVVYTKASDLEWLPVDEPPMPKGMEVAMIDGDPTKKGKFLAFLKFPAGATLEPHNHPLKETLMVARGSMRFGQGEKVGERATLLTPGGFVDIPSNTYHWLSAGSEGTTLLVIGNGPMTSNFYPGPAKFAGKNPVST